MQPPPAAIPVRSILVLMHERQPDAINLNYRVWPLIANWRRAGIDVRVQHGIRQRPDADLLFPHVDVSTVPEDYWQFIQSYPRVVNRHVRDIRKTRVSANLVRRGDAWDGPVIVKTAGNCAGLSDHRFSRSDGPTPLDRLRHRIVNHPRLEPSLLRFAKALSRYYIFDRLRDVPAGVFANPHLVVEKFLPERDSAGNYVMRMWIALGSRGLGRVLRGTDPYVKNVNAALEEFTTPPPQVEAWRRAFRLDYGKIDFLLHNGTPVIIDANTTPTVSGDAHSEKYRAQSEAMAEGIAEIDAGR